MARRVRKIRILGVIPARGGSRGIPRKNIASLLGKPLIYYTIRAAQQSRLLDAFIVSTDDPEIAAVARRLGADVPFLRPKKFARYTSTDIEWLRHAVLAVEKERGWRPEIIVTLYPTAPLRTARDIDRVLQFMLDTGCDSVRTVASPSPHNPFKMWSFIDEKKGKIKPLLRTKHYSTLGTDVPRQTLPKIYWQTGMVNATRTKFIKRGVIWGPDVRGVITDPLRTVDLDEPKDLKQAERIMRELKIV
ncbi:MAG: acylneuraminate cytidylyltransferase family protein [Candidatus Yanofskybacteria bacterium]|nr:acylneuraminate cytidylyltransferase family protein [Candidatus Yanofskybacteria bacterium]